MNAVRYYLAICILVTHFSYLSGEEIITLPRVFGGAGSFFALSGFLMFPSFEKRNSVKKFFVRRSQRIFPPYFLIVIVAAIGLSFISSIPMTDYFTDLHFWKYLVANLLFMNFLVPDLPGVFEASTNLYPFVNGALWTMKGEIVCYLSVPVIYWVISHYRKYATHLLTVLVGVFYISYIGCTYLQMSRGINLDVIQKQFNVLMLFYLGALLNLKLRWLVAHRWWFIVVNATLIMSDYFGFMRSNDITILLYNVGLASFVTGTMVITCCITGHWGRFLSGHDALSYDIYLFHWPVIQVILFSGIINNIGVYTTLALSVCVTVLFAMLSWNFIGKRFLKSTPSLVPATL